jgi:hypothetical protein
MSAVVVGALALPGVARAANDLAISQTQSAKVVAKGEAVTFNVEVRNVGTGNEAVFVDLDSLSGHGRGADAPFTSFSASQGTCADRSGEAFGYFYNVVVCELGALAPGASAQITATVKANQSANYFATLLPNAVEGGYQDADNSNNAASGRVTVSLPPTISGSKKIKLKGLPSGCAPSDFTLRAIGKAPGVRKMKAILFYWEGEEGVTWSKSSKGNHLKARVPVSRLSNELGLFYQLKIKAKQGGGKHLTTTVTFQPC